MGARFRRVTEGTAASLLAQGMAVANQLILVPILLSAWGTQQYGEWLSLAAIVGYLTILDIGIQTYSTNRMTQCRATGDLDQYNRVLNSALALNLTLAALAVLVVIPALGLIPFSQWFHLRATDTPGAWLVASLLALQTIGAIPFGIITGIYRTIGEYPREQLVNIARSAISLTATATAALAGAGLAVVAAVQLTALLLPALYTWRDLRKRRPEVRLGVSMASRRMAVSFLHPSLLFLLLQLGAAATLQGSTLMVSGFFGATAVATFVSLRTLANLSQQGITSVRAAMWPEVAAMEATGDYAGLRRVHMLLSKTSMMIWLCAAVVLHFEGAALVRLWSKGRIHFEPAVMDGVLLLYGSYALWATSSILLGASNRHRTMTWIYASGCVSGLTLAYFLGRSFGLPGLVCGLAAADFVFCGAWIPRIACTVIGQSFPEFLLQVLGRGAVAAFPVAGVGFAAANLLAIRSDVFRLAVIALFTGLAGALALFGVWFNGTERERVTGIVRSGISRLRRTAVLA